MSQVVLHTTHHMDSIIINRDGEPNKLGLILHMCASPPHHTIQINISMHILSPPFRSLLSVMKEGNDENGERNETKQQWTGIQFKIALTFCACVRTRVHVCVSVSACPSVFLDVWRTTGHYLICHLQLYVGKCQMNQGPNVCDLKYSFAVLLQSLCRHNKW